MIWLFRAEPVYRYADDERESEDHHDWQHHWPYTAVTFRTIQAGVEIEMYIEPGYQEVRLKLRNVATNIEFIDMDLREVGSVEVEHIRDRELLGIHFRDNSPAHTLWLRMKPDVLLTWSHG